MRVEALSGAALDRALDDVAALRIAVFRDWPYLYDGDLDYERAYLQPYRNNPRAIVAGAIEGDLLVGAATGTPMEDHAEEFASAFADAGLELSDIFYCAESVLLPAYRGRGVGHRFFDIREAQARALGRSHVAFCAVVRPSDHPLKPTAYQPLDRFWRARGYAPMPDVQAHFSWKDVDQAKDTLKPLQFWMRPL